MVQPHRPNADPHLGGPWHRRRLQFSLGALLLTVAFAAATLGTALWQPPLAVFVVTAGAIVVAWKMFRSTSARVGAIAVTCAVGMAAFMVVMAVLGLDPHSVSARRVLCRNNLRYLALATYDYALAYGSLPPACAGDAADSPACSWRVRILPYLEAEHSAAYRRYNRSQPWDSQANACLLNTPFVQYFYACPSDRAARRNHMSSYCAVVGPNTLWPPDRGRRLNELSREDYKKILLLEVPQSNVVWMEPKDITMEEAVRLFRSGELVRSDRHAGGLHYVTLGGESKPVSSIGSVEEFVDLLQIHVTAAPVTPGQK